MLIWVFAEEIEGAPSSLSLEMLTKARQLDADIAAFYVGAGSPAAFATLGAHGASRVYHLDTGGTLAADPAATAIAALVGEHHPDLILFGLTFTDRDVAGRLSARLDVPVLSNAVDLAADGGQARVINEILGGTTLVETSFTGEKPWIVVVRAKAFTAAAGAAAEPEVVPVEMPDVAHPATVVESHAEASEGPRLEDAAVVVTAGRGMTSADRLAPLTELAGILGAAIGATRAVVDAGWLPFSSQVGQTGTTVRPAVYLAFGLSGAMQHLVGMKDSGTIIAVNKDEEAPIFAVADLGIVGDAHAILPRLVAALQGRS
jgi:electron transfer flavoprotein alpha subunit